MPSSRLLLCLDGARSLYMPTPAPPPQVQVDGANPKQGAAHPWDWPSKEVPAAPQEQWGGRSVPSNLPAVSGGQAERDSNKSARVWQSAGNLPRVRAPSRPTLRPHRLQPARLLCPRDSPGKKTGAGCQALLQPIFPTQGLSLRLLHWQMAPLPLSRLSDLLYFTVEE